MSKRNLALIGATIVSIIYGVTFTIAKDVMPAYIDAFGFILLRVGGSVLLFWLTWLFMPKEKIALGDFPRIIAAAFFGVAFNMLTFFKGLSLTSPISAAVIMVSTPMIVLVLSAIIMKERLKKRKVFGNWLKRSRYYIPLMKEILKEQGLPEDLVYLAMIESGFNPKAYSPAKACGPWQFIYETGGRYGLKVNYLIDERRDPEKSTVAATKYLKDLFNQFGCWYLAAAGYNSGEKRVERAVEKHGTNDFWEIVKYNTLPRETREYIPKLIAAAIIAKDPERYGFGSIVYDEPIRFSLIKVPAGSPLVAIARSASIDLAALRQTNPEILRGITPPDMDNYEVKLPYNIDKNRFSDNLENLLSDSRRVKGFITYKVKKGILWQAYSRDLR